MQVTGTDDGGRVMAPFIGITVIVAAVVVLAMWVSRRTPKPSGAGQDISARAQRTKRQAQNDATRWGSGI